MSGVAIIGRHYRLLTAECRAENWQASDRCSYKMLTAAKHMHTTRLDTTSLCLQFRI